MSFLVDFSSNLTLLRSVDDAHTLSESLRQTDPHLLTSSLLFLPFTKHGGLREFYCSISRWDAGFLSDLKSWSSIPIRDGATMSPIFPSVRPFGKVSVENRNNPSVARQHHVSSLLNRV